MRSGHTCGPRGIDVEACGTRGNIDGCALPWDRHQGRSLGAGIHHRQERGEECRAVAEHFTDSQCGALVRLGTRGGAGALSYITGSCNLARRRWLRDQSRSRLSLLGANDGRTSVHMPENQTPSPRRYRDRHGDLARSVVTNAQSPLPVLRTGTQRLCTRNIH